MWVNRYIGIPYRRYGRDIVLDGGLDCWGLVREVYKNELNIELPSFAGEYEADRKRVYFDSINRVFLREAVDWMRVDEAQEFDIAALARFGVVYHTGIALNAQKMLHLENRAGSCVETFIDKTRFNLYGVYRYVC
jgi:cell wall-associated NlpC family hydrolase